ncbi:hypothetical protein [Hydrogenoanaerobacterium sp.]|uniref:hypothetical protein n=1 Tax=Hydrogenoanaerobacterium sp. TaxID=2953763 RepID=UPI002896EB3C|nr:hypothetical protein [Hydrogenoanaerobacterium sp.]
MCNLKLAQSFSMIALNAQDSRYMTTVKKISLRCIAAAVILEIYLDGGFTQTGYNATLQKSVSEQSDIALYQETVLNALAYKKGSVNGNLKWWLAKASKLSMRKLKKLERAIADFLMGADLLEEIPNLLGCDLFYDGAGVKIKEYRSNIEEYTRITESIRAEILEEGSVTDETILMLWLLRESACLHDIFSKNELQTVALRIYELRQSSTFAKAVFEIDIHRGIEIAIKGLLNAKKTVIKTSTGTGVNFIFPFFERSQSVFIDTEAWFSNSNQRLSDVKARLEANGHSYTVLREGQVPLIKVDNILYEAVPEAIQGRVPIHGVRLRKYPI